jgi:hypothetical protein
MKPFYLSNAPVEPAAPIDGLLVPIKIAADLAREKSPTASLETTQ